MDPTIAGALIGGGAALIGFGASAWQNSANLRTTQRFARDQRLWEKRTALYEALLDIVTGSDTSSERRMDLEDAKRDLERIEAHRIQILAYGSDVIYQLRYRALRAAGPIAFHQFDQHAAADFYRVAFEMREQMRSELLEGSSKPRGPIRRSIRRYHRLIELTRLRR
jgi:hypothetical protein